MADVGGERGQLLTIVGIVLAVALVTLAMVANTVIFTENLATRETTRTIEDTGEYREATTESLSTALDRVNDNSTSTHGTLLENFSRAVDSQERILQRDVAGGGASIDLSIQSSTNGTQLRQTDSSRAFTAGDVNAGAANWTLAEDVSEASRFKINVSRQSLYPATVDTLLSVLLDNAFTVRVDNASSTWRTYFFQGPLTDNVYVITDEPGGSLPVGNVMLNLLDGTCAYDSPMIRTDFVAGTVNGNDCGELAYFADLDEEYNISYENAETLGVDRATGTYDIRVTDADVHQDNFYEPTTSPFASASIAASGVELQYQTTDLDYRARLDVKPASAGSTATLPSPGERPSVTIDSIVDDTDSALLEKYDFDIQANLSDPDGDLAQVRFVLTDDEGSEVANVTNSSISGSSVTASHRFQSTNLLASLEDDGNFTIQVAVTDQEGLSDSVAETHKADGDDTLDGDVYPSVAAPVDEFGAAVPASVGETSDGADLQADTGGDLPSSRRAEVT